MQTPSLQQRPSVEKPKIGASQGLKKILRQCITSAYEFWKMPGRFRLPLFLFALAGALSSAAVLHEQVSFDTKTEEKPNGDVREVIVAKHQLRPGDVLTTENLAIGRVPVGFLDDGMLSPDKFPDLDGSVMTESLSSGQALLKSHLAQTAMRHPTLGLRRIQLVVEDRYAFKKLPLPGDFVDFFWQLPANHQINPSGQEVGSYLVEDVRLVSIRRADAGDHQNASRRSKGTWIHIEVEVLPEPALRLLRASTAGTLQMVLRNPDDRSIGAPPLKNQEPAPISRSRSGHAKGIDRDASANEFKAAKTRGSDPQGVTATLPEKAATRVEVIRGGQRTFEPMPYMHSGAGQSQQNSPSPANAGRSNAQDRSVSNAHLQASGAPQDSSSTTSTIQIQGIPSMSQRLVIE